MNSAESRNLYEILLWGQNPTAPVPMVSSTWMVLGAVGCLLAGLPWLTLVPLVTWNGLVRFRNRLRCETRKQRGNI